MPENNNKKIIIIKNKKKIVSFPVSEFEFIGVINALSLVAGLCLENVTILLYSTTQFF